MLNFYEFIDSYLDKKDLSIITKENWEEIDLLNNGVLDSIDFLELILSLEKHFSIKISISDLDIQNPGKLANLEKVLKQKINE